MFERGILPAFVPAFLQVWEQTAARQTGQGGALADLYFAVELERAAGTCTTRRQKALKKTEELRDVPTPLAALELSEVPEPLAVPDVRPEQAWAVPALQDAAALERAPLAFRLPEA